MKKPNFFIVGAPKCGTTALSDYLSGHDDIFVTTPKEPHFFATDLPGYQIVKDSNEYELLFGPATNATIAGEASVFYLLSDDAIPSIAQYNPRAKIIVMLRNPIDLVYSFHAQMLFSHDENIADFGRAWRLCDDRRQGKHIPPRCRDPKLLQYDKVALLGKQLQRLYEYFPKNNVLTILFQDFVENTEAEYGRAIEFLGAQSHERTEFPRINESRRHRSPLLANLLFTKTGWMSLPVSKVKALLGIKEIGLLKFLRRVETKRQKRQDLESSLREEIYENYSEDIRLLERLLGRKLKDWC